MKYELIIRSQKLEQVKRSIETMMAVLDCPARVEVVVRCTTDEERLVRVIQTLLPGEVTVVSFGMDMAKTIFNGTQEPIEAGTVVKPAVVKPVESGMRIIAKMQEDYERAMAKPTMEEMLKAGQSMPEVGVLPEKDMQPAILKERECPGCGNEFTPIRQHDYRCNECSKAGKAQRKYCYTTIINGVEYLFAKEILIKRMNEGRFQPGTKFSGPSGKHWLVVKENDAFELKKV